MRRRDGTLFPGTEVRLYTTVELLATEQRMIDQAIAGIGAGRWVVPHRLVEARLRHHRDLTDGRRHMVRRFATSGNVIDIGVGPASVTSDQRDNVRYSVWSAPVACTAQILADDCRL